MVFFKKWSFIFILLVLIPLFSGEHVYSDGSEGYISVAVATLWSNPNQARGLDKPSVTTPVDLWKWTKEMNDTEKRWLVGKLESQALLGQRVIILEEKGNWVKVAIPTQPTPRNILGYPGWIPKEQVTFDSTYTSLLQNPFIVVKTNTAWLYKNQSNNYTPFMEVSFNTRLPFLEEREGWVKVAVPGDSPLWIQKSDLLIYKTEMELPTPTPESIILTAKYFLGLPYLWAGLSGFGFDCSGFTYTIYHFHGITIPRDSADQAVYGKPVSQSELRAGDLLFFANDQGKGRVRHVGIYVGDGMMIHSPQTGSPVEIISLDDPRYSYKRDYAGARRYFD